MRHNVYGKKLGRNKNQRTALFRGLVSSLLIQESIQTTEPKAKAIKGLVDKIITQAKSPTTKRMVSQFLTQKVTQDKLFKDLLPRLKNRNSGYTSMVRLGKRLGDGAMLVRVNLLAEEAKEKVSKETKVTKESKVEEKVELVDAEVVTEPTEKKSKKETKK